MYMEPSHSRGCLSWLLVTRLPGAQNLGDRVKPGPRRHRSNLPFEATAPLICQGSRSPTVCWPPGWDVQTELRTDAACLAPAGPGLFPRVLLQAGVNERDLSALALLLSSCWGLLWVNVRFMGAQGFPEPVFSEKGNRVGCFGGSDRHFGESLIRG